MVETFEGKTHFKNFGQTRRGKEQTLRLLLFLSYFRYFDFSIAAQALSHEQIVARTPRERERATQQCCSASIEKKRVDLFLILFSFRFVIVFYEFVPRCWTPLALALDFRFNACSTDKIVAVPRRWK